MPSGRSLPRARGRRPTRDRRVDRLERVVGLRQEREVGGRRGVRAVRRELRQPEAVQVRLVADDDLVEARQQPRDRGRVLRELRPARSRRAGSSAGRRCRRRRRPRPRSGRPRLATLRSSRSSSAVGATSPGSQFVVMRTAVNPASRSCAIFASAVGEVGRANGVLRAPSVIAGPAASARPARTPEAIASSTTRGGGGGSLSVRRRSGRIR